MKKIFLTLTLVWGIPSLSFSAANNDINGSPLFTGLITEESVDEFINKNEGRAHLTDLYIASQGGDVRAAIRFAHWIHSKGLNVNVRNICYSACANYIFPAGKNKKIERGAFVAWHGDMEQKDFRELVSKYDLIEKNLAEKNSDVEKSDLDFLKENQLRYKSIKDLRKQQDSLYRLLGVKAEVGRLGQEPVNYPSDGWTLTVRAMKYFGISNVDAPTDYGTDEYFKRDPGVMMINKGPLLIFDLSDSGKVFSVNFKDP